MLVILAAVPSFHHIPTKSHWPKRRQQSRQVNLKFCPHLCRLLDINQNTALWWRPSLFRKAVDFRKACQNSLSCSDLTLKTTTKNVGHHLDMWGTAKNGYKCWHLVTLLLIIVVISSANLLQALQTIVLLYFILSLSCLFEKSPWQWRLLTYTLTVLLFKMLIF